MRNSRTVRLLGAIAGSAALALTAVGCASGDSEGGGDGATEFEVFSFWTSGSESDALQELFDLYEEQNPGVTIINGAVAGGGGSNAVQVLQSRIAGNDAPPTWQTFPGAQLQGYVAGGLVADLSATYEGLEDVVPENLMDIISVDGTPYGVITGNHRNNIVWWNKTVAADLGLDFGDSVSWSDYESALAAATAGGVDGLCLGDKDIFASVIVAEMAILGELGVADMNALADGDLGWDDPRVAAGLDKFSTVLEYTNSNHAALTWDQAVAQFAEGGCLFNIFPDSAYGELIKLEMNDDADFGYFPFPETDGIFLNVADAFAVNAALDDPANAMAWTEVIMSPEGQVAFNALKGSTPSRTDVDVSSYGPYQQGAAESFRNDELIATMTFGISIEPAVQQALYDATTAFVNSGDTGAFASTMDAAAQG